MTKRFARKSRTLTAALAVLVSTSYARADEPDTALAFLTGASIFLAGFGAGSVLLASSSSNHTRDNAGWLTIDSGFVIAPLAAHGVTAEWLRGMAFASAPAATMAGTGALFEAQPQTVRHGNLTQQRILWGLFGVGLFSSAAGVVDASLADGRSNSVVVTPSVGRGEVGVEVGGTL